MQELAKRVFISVIFIPVLILALYFEGIPLYLMFLIVSVFGAQEYTCMIRKAGIQVPWLWILINPLLYSLWVFFPEYEISILWLGILLALLQPLIVWDQIKSVPRMFAMLFGVIYTALMPAMIVKIGWYIPVKNILLALILMIWIVDTIAYFIGMHFGKKRDITPVSPRKSREGFFAGVLAPVLISLILYFSGFKYFSAMQLCLIVVAAGIMGQLGDLLESMLKRYCKVKDSSKLIPGHGGILDRTDSILLAGSFLYAALQVF
jgi:phosphatidate cytidylyltransferase